MKDIKKKIAISSLALAMAITSTSFAMYRIHGETTPEAKPEAKPAVKQPVKALFTKMGTVTGRGNDDTTNSTNINDYTTITDLMIDKDVTSIPANKFAGFTNITTLTFKGADGTGDSASKVTTIGVNAFKGLGITTVVLPKALTNIDAGAFSNNKLLTSVDFKNTINLENIKTGAFENSGLTTLDLSPMDNSTPVNARLTVYTNAFKGNKNLASVTLSSKMQALESEVFASTNVTAIEIKEHLNQFSPTAFKGTPLATITVDTKNKSFAVESNVLYNNKKTRLLFFPEGKTDTEFTLINSVTHIDPNAFSSSPTLKKVITTATLTNIGASAFDDAKKLTEIELKEGLTQIDRFAFRGTGLTKIALTEKIQGIEMNAFAGASNLATLDLRKATVLKTVKANAFKDTALASIIIGDKTGPLDQIVTGAFNSSATSRKITLMNDSNALITGNEAAVLIKKYARLKFSANGAWTFDVKLPTPVAAINYDTMKLTGLLPSTVYTIETIDYTTDGNGTLDIVKEWGGKQISIAQTEKDDQITSDAQKLDIDQVYTLTTMTINGNESTLKKVGTTIHASAPSKKGHVFKTWEISGVTVTDVTQKTIAFTMPANDVSLTTKYTKIVINNPVVMYEAKADLVVTITTPMSNFKELIVDGTPLKKDTDYTVTGSETTTITLKVSYLDTLKDTTNIVVGFHEGGRLAIIVRLPKSAPMAVADYDEMNLIGLDANAKYKINAEEKTADAKGKIAIEKSWGGKTLEIIKAGAQASDDSKPQRLRLQTFYSITVDNKELRFAVAGTKVTVEAKKKDGHKFNKWTVTGVELVDATNETITVTMPKGDVSLVATYTQIVTTAPADMVYNGNNAVSVRFNIAMEEFKGIEYGGKLLVKDVDYTVTSGSTIITFTKAFLDKMKDGMNGMKAVFTNDEVTFAIQHEGLAQPLNPVGPVVTPTTPNMLPETPRVLPTPAKKTANSPKTGDTTNTYVLFAGMLVSAGALVVVKKRKKQS